MFATKGPCKSTKSILESLIKLINRHWKINSLLHVHWQLYSRGTIKKTSPSHPSYDRSVHSVVLTDDGCQGEFRWTGWREIGLSSPWTDDTKRCAGLPVSHQMVNERDTGDRVTNTTNQIIKSKPCVQWRTPGEGDDVSAEFEPLLCFSASCLKIYFHLTAFVWVALMPTIFPKWGKYILIGGNKVRNCSCLMRCVHSCLWKWK